MSHEENSKPNNRESILNFWSVVRGGVIRGALTGLLGGPAFMGAGTAISVALNKEAADLPTWAQIVAPLVIGAVTGPPICAAMGLALACAFHYAKLKAVERRLFFHLPELPGELYALADARKRTDVDDTNER